MILRASFPRIKPELLVPGRVSGPYEYVLEHATGYERGVLEYIHDECITWERNHVQCRIDCRDIGEMGHQFFNRQWHTDTTMGQRWEKDEIHHIFATPPGTHFLHATTPHGVTSQSRAEPYTVITYGRTQVHKTPLVMHATRRLVIRVSESDIHIMKKELHGRTES